MQRIRGWRHRNQLDGARVACVAVQGLDHLLLARIARLITVETSEQDSSGAAGAGDRHGIAESQRRRQHAVVRLDAEVPVLRLDAVIVDFRTGQILPHGHWNIAQWNDERALQGGVFPDLEGKTRRMAGGVYADFFPRHEILDVKTNDNRLTMIDVMTDGFHVLDKRRARAEYQYLPALAPPRRIPLPLRASSAVRQGIEKLVLGIDV